MSAFDWYQLIGSYPFLGFVTGVRCFTKMIFFTNSLGARNIQEVLWRYFQSKNFDHIKLLVEF